MSDLLENRGQSSGRNPEEIAALFALALQHHQRGDLNAAWNQYQVIVARQPDHVESLHHLGVIALQTGQHELSIELIGRAIGLNDRVPDFHYNIGIAYGSLGKIDQVIAHNRKAIELKPDYGAALMNLGKALLAYGRADEAIDNYTRAVASMPKSPDAHLGLANALADAGQLDAAETQYRKVLVLNHRDADAHNNLGTLLAAQGKRDEAIVCYQQALRLNPGLAMAEFNLGAMLAADKRHADACGCFQRALKMRPDFAAACKGLGKALQAMGDLGPALEAFRKAQTLDDTLETRMLLYTALTDLRSIPYAHRYCEELIQAMAEMPGGLRVMASAVFNALMGNAVLDKCTKKASRETWPTVFTLSDLQEIAKDRLLLALLKCEQIGSEQFERLLTAMRAALLDMASQLGPADMVDETLLTLHCALARQCFLTEYVFSLSDREFEQAQKLQAALAECLRSGAAIHPMWVAAVATYAALHTLPDAKAMQSRSWPAPVDAVIKQQIAVPQEVQRVAATIPRLTPIDDEVSQLVARQYEDNPFPRWDSLPIAQKAATTVNSYLRSCFPAVSANLEDGADGYDYLIAGCGTGHHAATVARQFDKLRITAIDLSRASLGYAKYKAESLGLTDVAFAQADILALGTVGKTFDVIDSVGVLHHMANPQAGWRALLDVLRPRGCMRIGLYSEMARRNIVATRQLIAEKGYGASADEIRRCRQDLLAHADGSPAKEATKFWDFYSLSECRDLLFHVQEHRLALPQIGQFLADNELELIGLEVPKSTQTQYGKRFPSDKSMTDLDNWHAFEQDNPDTFINMYLFWVQRKMDGHTSGR